MPSRVDDNAMHRLARLLPALVAMLCVVLSPASAVCAVAAPTPAACPMDASGACCCAHGDGHAMAADAGCDSESHALTGCTMRPAETQAAVPASTSAFVPATAILPPTRVSMPPLPAILAWQPYAAERGYVADASPPPLPSRAPPIFSF